MDEIPILGNDDEARMLKRLVAHYDAPAYIRRARQVQEAFDQLVERCRRKRQERCKWSGCAWRSCTAWPGAGIGFDHG
jgi:hypothetical protein